MKLAASLLIGESVSLKRLYHGYCNVYINVFRSLILIERVFLNIIVLITVK